MSSGESGRRETTNKIFFASVSTGSVSLLCLLPVYIVIHYHCRSLFRTLVMLWALYF